MDRLTLDEWLVSVRNTCRDLIKRAGDDCDDWTPEDRQTAMVVTGELGRICWLVREIEGDRKFTAPTPPPGVDGQGGE